MAFDVKQMSRNDQVVAGAGVLVLILSFLDWYSVKGFGVSQGVGPWNMDFFGAKLAIICSVLAAAWVLALAAGVDTSAVKAAPRLVALGLAAAAVLLMIIQWTKAEDVNIPGVDAGWSFLFYLALLVTIVQAVFAYLAFQQSGGTAGTTAAPATGGGDYPPPPPPTM